MSSTILFVENGISGGGSAESLYHLLSVIDRKKFKPLVVFTSKISHKEKIKSLGIDSITLDGWYLSNKKTKLSAITSRILAGVVFYGAKFFPALCLTMDRFLTKNVRRKLVDIIKNKNVCLVHTNNNAHRDLWAIEAADSAGVLCISHLRSFNSFGFSHKRAQLANKRVNQYLAYSRSIAEFWIEKGIDRERLQIVHNAIGTIKNDPLDLCKSLGIPNGAPVLGITGRIIPVRGHEFLINEMPALQKEFPDIRLLIIGRSESADQKRLEDLAESLNVSNAILFLGHRDDAHRIIASLDISVLPYTIEPFGRTLLESWQLGVPVVASRVGHIEDIVEDKKTAMLFDLDNTTELVSAITILLRDRYVRHDIIRNAKQICASKFSIDAQGEVIGEIYERLLKADTQC